MEYVEQGRTITRTLPSIFPPHGKSLRIVEQQINDELAIFFGRTIVRLWGDVNP